MLKRAVMHLGVTLRGNTHMPQVIGIEMHRHAVRGPTCKPLELRAIEGQIEYFHAFRSCASSPLHAEVNTPIALRWSFNSTVNIEHFEEFLPGGGFEQTQVPLCSRREYSSTKNCVIVP